MDRKYNLRLDLQFRCNNSVMKFRQSDNNTSDFFMRVTSGGELFNIENAIVILATIKPNQDVQCQFLEIKEGKIYADLNANMKDQVGTYKAQALLIYEDERVSTDVIEYEVTEDSILNQLETTVSATEDFTLLQQMLSRLSVVENSENLRVENENNRVEAEKLREEAIEKIKSDTTKLISDTKKEISDYKNAKDTAINEDLTKYKQDTNQAIDNYKSAKDTEINDALNKYKSSTTKDIEEFKNAKSQELEEFKNTKNTEIDNYKKEKDLAINQYMENKNLALNEYVTDKNRELDEYKGAKDKEIDQYKNTKDKLINDKISEVEEAKQNIVSTANNKISELDQAKTNMQNDVNAKLEEADNRITELQNFESQLDQIENKNTEQDNRLKNVEYKNKTQQTMINGLFNENKDGRLTIEGEGNSLKLEGSKKGLATVNKVVGDTLVNIISARDMLSNHGEILSGGFIKIIADGTYRNTFFNGLSKMKSSTDYTIIAIVKENTLNGNYVLVSSTNEAPYEHVGVVKSVKAGTTGVFKIKVTTRADISTSKYALRSFASTDSTEGYITIAQMLLEGDYTNKPIPQEVLEGMQSTFEECKVTQEMVDSGEELEENLGKYKYVAKVKGKNMLDIDYLENKTNWIDNTHAYISIPIDLKPNTSYIFSCDSISAPTSQVALNVATKVWEGINYEENEVCASLFNTTTADSSKYNVSFTTSNKTQYYLQYYVNNCTYPDYTVDDQWFTRIAKNIMIEEGTQATTYEPYFERTQTVYLNSPLLKGDELVCKEDGLYHYHKMKQNIFDGSEDENWSVLNNRFWINNNDIKVGGFVMSDKYATDTYRNLFYNNNNCIAIHDTNKQINIKDMNYSDVKSFKGNLKTNNIKIVGELAEPYYEKISDDKLLLEIPNNATLSVESVIPCQNISVSYTGGIPSLYGMEDDITTLQDTSVDIIATSWDTDYRLSEVEWALEELTGTQQINLLSERGINTMALSRFEQAKIIILGDAYYRPTFEKQLATYLKRGYLTQEEYDILIAMMDARETIEGEQ